MGNPFLGRNRGQSWSAAPCFCTAPHTRREVTTRRLQTRDGHMKTEASPKHLATLPVFTQMGQQRHLF